ncbi:MAG: S1C family serine protease [Planctomycetota bacterium]
MSNRRMRLVTTLALAILCFMDARAGLNAQDERASSPLNQYSSVVRSAQSKIVKINGGGGFRGLESYQSGFLISDDGLVLTSWSYVLDADAIYVTLDDGTRNEGKLVGYDPQLEIAVLKIDATAVDHFNLDTAVLPRVGSRVLALSNLFRVATGDEPVSVQRGFVSAVTNLSARKGAFESVYQGPVFLIDAITNNPGASGGVIINREGRLIGMIGKEVKDSSLGTWLNFGIPIETINQSVQEIRDGKMIVQREQNQRKPTEPMTLELLGVVLVPDVVNQTPPFIDRIVADSAADKAGLAPDDLLISIDGQLTPGTRDVRSLLESIDRDATFQLMIRRGKSFETIQLKL